MALRHQVPQSFGDYKPKQDMRMPSLMRRPVTIEFRKGADMRQFVKDMDGNVSVRVDAAVGAGKSTLLPKELALVRGVLVFHITANPLLVRSIYQYVSKCANDNSAAYPSLELFTDYDQDIPKSGVYYIGAAAFVGLMLRRGGLESFKDCVVFLDEAHESDAYTHVIRNLSLLMGAGSLVQASATFSAGDFRRVESSGTVVKSKYDCTLTPDKWNLEDISKPWCYAGIRDALVIFTDSRAYVKRLAAGYSELGIRTHSLVAGMDEMEYDSAIQAMRDKRGELVVIFADSSFRSGVTWETSRIIDTAKVSYFDPQPGVLKKKSRSAFNFELEQAAGRGGRVSGLRTEYFRPDYEPESIICDLEGVEAEGAAFLYRLLGFRPVRELSSCVMAYNDLPHTVSTVVALNGLYPLTYYLRDSDSRIKITGGASEDKVQAGESTSEARDASPSLGDSIGVGPSQEAAFRGFAGAVPESLLSVSTNSRRSSFDSVAKSSVTMDTDLGSGVGEQAYLRDGRPSESSSDAFDRHEKQPDVTVPACDGDLRNVGAGVGDAHRFSRDMQSADGNWSRIVASLDRPKTPALEIGNLCEPVAFMEVPSVSFVFPQGLASCLEYMEAGNVGVRLAGLARADKAYLLDKLISRYNFCAVEVMAAGQALLARSDNISQVAVFPGVREYFLGVVEGLAALDTEQVGLYAYMRRVVSDEELKDMADTDQLVLDRMREHLQEFDGALERLSKPGCGMIAGLRRSLRATVKNSELMGKCDRGSKVRFAIGVNVDVSSDALGFPARVSDISNG